MTKEQEEAIERLNRFKTVSVLYSKTLAIPVKNLKELQVNIETVLSMLKEKDAEIEQKNTELAEKSAEIKKKDKIIDLMAEQIKIPEPTMKIESFDIKPKTKFGMRYLNKEEVKQYFERKVKDEK